MKINRSLKAVKKRESSNLGNKKGITLIALTITIIVILILAGVTIQTLTGDNGLLQKAQTAKQKNEDTTDLEQLQLTINEAVLKGSGKLTKSNLNMTIESIFGETIVGEDNGPWKVTIKGQTYKIESNCEIIKFGNSKEITSSDYGKYVDYILPEGSLSEYSGKWQIFYADDENVYLISEGNHGNVCLKDHISGYSNISELLNTEKYPVTEKWVNEMEDIDLVDSPNMKATLYLLDSQNVWNNLYKNNYSDYAVGAPTLELLVASYNIINGTSLEAIPEYKTYRDWEKWYGYSATINSGLKNSVNGKQLWNDGTFNYWLASASTADRYYVENISKSYERVTANNLYNSTEIGLRPVICLSSKVILTWDNSKNAYTLKY